MVHDHEWLTADEHANRLCRHIEKIREKARSDHNSLSRLYMSLTTLISKLEYMQQLVDSERERLRIR